MQPFTCLQRHTSVKHDLMQIPSTCIDSPSIHLLYVYDEAQARWDHVPRGEPPFSQEAHLLSQGPKKQRCNSLRCKIAWNINKLSEEKELKYLMDIFIPFHIQQVMAHGIICPLMNYWSNLDIKQETD